MPSGFYRHIVCRQCENEAQRIRDHTPERAENRKFGHLRRRYGLTPETYRAMLGAQDGKCKICLKELHRPFVDHNHTTGRVRGLLCGPCNMYIGHIKENLEALTRAIDYLVK